MSQLLQCWSCFGFSLLCLHAINHMIRFLYLCVCIGQECRGILVLLFAAHGAVLDSADICCHRVWSVSVYVTDQTYQKLKLIYSFSSWPSSLAPVSVH